MFFFFFDYSIYKQYRIFLQLHFEKHGSILIPTKDIDEMWHAHILHTRKYVAFCKDVFGCYLHHNPHAREVSDKNERKRMFLKTKSMIEIKLKETIGNTTPAICDDDAYCD